MPARQQVAGLTLGFFGTGAMDVDHGMVLIEEFIDARIKPDDKTRWVFMLTSDEFTQTLSEYAAMAKESQVAYEVITRPDDKSRPRAFNEISDDAAKIYNVEDPVLQMEQLLKEAPQSALLVLWDREREDDMEQIVSGFLDSDIAVFDLTDAMAPIGFEPGDSEAADPHAAAHAVVDAVEAEDAEEIYSRTELKEMSMQRLKEVAAELGLPPRKARETMINEILGAQGGEPETTEVEDEVEEESQVVAVVEEVTQAVEDQAATLIAFVSALDELGKRFLDELTSRLNDATDEACTRIATAVEGVIFNATPEPSMAVEPEPVRAVEEPPRRRLARRAS